MEDPLHRCRILLGDDDAGLLLLLSAVLSGVGACVSAAEGGLEGLRKLCTQQPDLVVLDLMIPGMDGLKACRRIRRLADVPVVILTAVGEQAQLTRALRERADEYVVKPFSTGVLLARLRAILRRGKGASQYGAHWRVLDDGRFVVDMEDHRVWVDGEMVDLTQTEGKVLACLIEDAGHPIAYNQILDRVWGPHGARDRSYVLVYASQLRGKLERDPHEPQILIVEPGIGYRLEVQGRLTAVCRAGDL